MLHKHINNYQFIVFSLYSLVFSSVLSVYALTQIQVSPVAYADEYYVPHQHIKINDTKILIFGDMMLDRGIRKQIIENGTEYPFNLIKDFISDNNIVVANAEGPFTSNNSVTLNVQKAPLIFTFDKAILPTLKKIGFTLLGQANNHTLNFGTKGLAESTTSITFAGLKYFGDPLNINIVPYITEINKQKIGFVAYNEFSYQGLDKVLATIREIKKEVSYLVVYPHWGEEYDQSFTKSQQKMAHRFIDAGADAVIGMHPHVIEPIEIYNGKPIFYSIGNFIFDQAQTGPRAEGLTIKIVLNKKFVTYEIVPMYIRKAQAFLMDDINKNIILQNLSKSFVNPDNKEISMIDGIIKIIR